MSADVFNCIKIKQQKRQSGQIVIAMIISAVVMTSGLLLFQYLGDAQNQTSRLKDYSDAQLVANAVLNIARAEAMRVQAANPVMVGGTGDPIESFRDFRITKDLSFQKSDTVALNGTSTWLGAALSKQYGSIVSLPQANIASVSVLVRSNGYPDQVNLTRRVQFEVRVKSRAHKGVGAFEVAVSKTYVLRLATMNYFGVILSGDVSGGQKLVSQINSTSARTISGNPDFEAVYFKGATLGSHTGGSGVSGNEVVVNQIADMPQLVAGATTASKVIFDRFYSNSRGLQVPDGMRIEDMKLTFPSGIETGVFQSAFSGAISLPWYGSNPAYEIPMDHSTLSQPIPYVPSSGFTFQAVTPTDQVSLASNSVAVLANTVLPNATLGFTKIEDTCATQSKPFIFLGGDTKDLTIDFNNPAGGALVFCGLVKAKKLIVKTPLNYTSGPVDIIMLGNFVVKQIEIDNNNRASAPFYKVRFLNPMDNPALPSGVSLPGGVVPSNWNAIYQSLSSSYTRNFFLPIGAPTIPFQPLYPYGNLPTINNYYLPCGVGSDNALPTCAAAGASCRCRTTATSTPLLPSVLTNSYNPDDYVIFAEDAI